MTPTTSAPRRAFLTAFIGMLLLQAAWVFTLPAFRGTDEIDHSYRAAEVAGGEWRPAHGAAPHGRGDLVRVPRTLVTAASPVCRGYAYMGPDNCRPAANLGSGEVLAASAAATYNPLYYLVVGTAARGMPQPAGLYVMRAVTALGCALLVAAAAWCLALVARSRWPLVGLYLALTPVAVFSTSVVAPNGVELSAALALWAGLLALLRSGGACRPRTLVTVAGVSSVLLVSMRSIGPLWAGLILLTVVCLVRPRRLGSIVAGLPRRTLGVWLAIVAVATGLSVWWTSSAGLPNFEPTPHHVDNPLTATLGQYPLWLLQGIAAFPRRMDAAPGLVYIVVGAICLAFLVAGLVASTRRARVVLLSAAVVSLLVPFVFTWGTIAATGATWQGRYGAPYYAGLLLMAGLSLDAPRAVGRGLSTGARAALGATAAAGLVAAHAMSVIHVLDGELLHSPARHSTSWVHLPAFVVVLLVVLAVASWSYGLLGLPSRPAPVASEEPDRPGSVAALVTSRA